MKGKHIYLAVTNDLVVDQRTHRTAMTLLEAGARPVLVGFRRFRSPEIPERPYGTHRLRLLFYKGFLFYACFNFRLFLFLMGRKSALLVSNDLDTLPAVYLASRLKNIPLVYDSHEYFTELPELVHRPFVRWTWSLLERSMLPGIKYGSTVCQSISDAYYEKYRIRLAVVRNLPFATGQNPDGIRHGGGAKENPREKTIIYQGSINMGRGLEGMIRAMAYLNTYHLLIFGEGTIKPELIRIRDSLSLADRVEFKGRVPFKELGIYTRQASLGISLEENIGLNYYYALPNKLFDYIQARIPVLVSDLPEMRRIVMGYDIGQVLKDPEPEKLSVQVQEMMGSVELVEKWKKNLQTAADELCWENEAGKLREVYREAGLPMPVIPPSP